MSNKHNITVNKTATYYTLGDVKTAKTIWFVLHGYGMLAKYFIKKFNPILTDNAAIVAPEGLSRFYTEGFYGRIGAAWMTKEDRENEIIDYINYLNQLYKAILIENKQSVVKINIVGFSQGGAVASRWVADGNANPTNFILWSSVFPDEMDFKTFGSNFNTFVIYGNNDEFRTEEQLIQQKKILSNSDLNYQLIEFEGTHDIPEDVLIQQVNKYNW